jgi:hypothetical protein
MDQHGVDFALNQRQISGTQSIHREGLLRLSLAILYVMHRSGIHNHVGAQLFQAIRHGVNIAELDVRMGEGTDFVPVAAKDIHDIDTELAVRTNYGDLHRSIAPARE